MTNDAMVTTLITQCEQYTMSEVFAKLQQDMILRAVRMNDGRIGKAANQLGISRWTVRRILSNA